MQRLRVGLLLCVMLALSGCSPKTYHEQVVNDTGTMLSAGLTLGQTFLARYDGLAAIEIYLVPQVPTTGTLHLHLRSDPEAAQDLAEGMLSLQDLGAPGYYRFDFAPQSQSYKRSFYCFLELRGDGSVQVRSGPADTYLNGALYRNHHAEEGQLAFASVYDPWIWLLARLQELLKWLGILAAAALLYVVPGWALCGALYGGWDQLPWFSKIGVAAGVSLALYPLLLLWTDLVGIHLGAAYSWLPALAGLAFLIWRTRNWRFVGLGAAWQAWVNSEAWLPDLLIGLSLLLVFGVRLVAVRLVDVPMWGDSYQHTVMAQILLDNKGLGHSWQPYAPYQGMIAHMGFPTATAVFSWFTGMNSWNAALMVGQLLNGLAILTLMPLASEMSGGRRWAIMGTVLTGGLLMLMPAYYVNWGRYAQLAGQVVLPVSLFLLWKALSDEAGSWRKAILAGLSLGGMLLHYYRMPYYYVSFIVVWLVGWATPHWRLSLHKWGRCALQMAFIAMIGLISFLPRAWQIMGSPLSAMVEAGVTTGSPLADVLADYQVWQYIAFYVPPPVLLLWAVGLVLSLIRRQWHVAALALWILGLSLVVAGRLIKLPGAHLMQSFAVTIFLYVPVSLMVGWLLGELARAASVRHGRVVTIVLSLATVVVSLWAVQQQQEIADPAQYALVTQPDLKAMSWIQTHTAIGARFLVEGFRIFDGRSAVGADAGWWIPLLGKRANTMPPQYAMINDSPYDAHYTQQAVDTVAMLEAESLAAPETVRRLQAQGITHIYIGQQQGQVNRSAPLFYAADLLRNPELELLYHQDRVYIFRIRSQ